MKNGETNESGSEMLRRLPPVDAVLNSAAARAAAPETGPGRLTEMARTALGILRRRMLEGSFETDVSREELLREAEEILTGLHRAENRSSLQPVINATGVIIHTNLGRAPLSKKMIEAMTENAAGYCNLEYDLETGRRGRRGLRAERLLAEITGAEDALIVNNCAAACVLVLTALAKGGEAIISRGEMVEIGGDFRIPDVMEQSGAILREVGATNRTRLSDYEKAVSENTRMMLKVHPSNYRIVGFTASPALEELARLAREKNIILYEDAGSGALIDLSPYGLDEPTISDSVKAGADVITFSGDKLLGSGQAGLIVGRASVVETLRRHPLYRALRVGKMIYAALEAAFDAFRTETAQTEILVLRMIAASFEEIRDRAENFARRLSDKLGEDSPLSFEIVKGNSVIGGGSAPTVQPETALLVLAHRTRSAAELEQTLRNARPPVITRIFEDKVSLDLRTVAADEEPKLLEILAEAG